MIDSPTLYRIAGWSAALAVVTLIISAIALAIFFRVGEPWGSINDGLIVVTALALIPAMVAIDRLAGGQAAWLRIVTIVAIAGAVLISVGQSLLIVRILSLEGSYVTGGIGLLPILVWLIALVVLAFSAGAIPASIGWTALASLVMIVVFSVVAMITMGPALWVAAVVLIGVLAAWLLAMSTTFLRVSAETVGAALA
jgi:hypothetical protein